jgi:hypothetical protein
MKFSILLSIQALCHSTRPIVVDPGTCHSTKLDPGTRHSTKLPKFWFADPGTLPFHETHTLDLDPSAVLLDIEYMVENSPSSTTSSEPDIDIEPVLPTPVPTTGTYFWSPILDSFLIRPTESESSFEEENNTMVDTEADDDAAVVVPSPGDTTTMTTAQLLQLIESLTAKTDKTFGHTLVAPRHGSISDSGVWTGMGASGSGHRPFSKYCMRAFKTDAIKNHQHMHPIEDKCKSGLRDSSELHFALSHEPNAHTVVTSIRAFEKFVASCGMDGVFTIVDRNLGKTNFLQQPGLVSLATIDDWCTDVLDKGVWGKDPNSGDPIRLPTCQYDLVNMDWSAEAVLNSCTPALCYDLETKVPIEDHNGPKLMMTLLTMLYRPSLSKLKELRETLEALDIRTYPGENITLFCHDASKLVCEIRMNFMRNAEVTDLTTAALTGLHHCSEELIRIRVRNISMDNDVNGFESSIGNKKADALVVLQEVEDMYRVLVNMKNYGPSKPLEKKGTPTAYLASSDAVKLIQNRTAASTTSRPRGECWDCGSKDHFRGDPNCKATSGSKGDTSSTTAFTSPSTGPPRHGLDAETVTKITELSAAMFLTMPPREHIPDDAEYKLELGGKIVAKYCRHCGRFVKGASQHYTKEHTGTRSLFAYKDPTTVTVAGMMANLSPVALQAGVDLTSVPTVDSSFLFRTREPTSYDFGSPAPQANLARASLSTRINAILNSANPEHLHDMLLKEFAG